MPPEFPPKPRGTRFPNLPPLPNLPDPSLPLRTLLDGIRQIQSQGDAVMGASDELAHTMKDGLVSLTQATKERLKSPPFPRKGS